MDHAGLRHVCYRGAGAGEAASGSPRCGHLIGNAMATIVIAKWENALDNTRMKQVLDGEQSFVA